MRRNFSTLSVLLLAVVLTAAVAGAAALKTALRFEPVFRIMQVKGDCTVQKPGAVPTRDPKDNREYFPRAQDQKAYPFGTRVMTGMGTADIFFTKYSHCMINSNCSVVVAEDLKDKRTKILRLETGKIEVMIEKGIEENTNSILVETSASVVIASNLTSFTVEAAKVGEVNQVVVWAIDQNIRVVNPALFETYLNALEKGKEKSLTVTSSPDGSYVRVTDNKGIYGLKVRNPGDPIEQAGDEKMQAMLEGVTPDGKPPEEFEGVPNEPGFRVLKMEPGVSVKFNHRKHGPTDAHVVAMLVVSAEGAKIQEITYNERKQTPAPVIGEGAEAGAVPALEEPKEGAAKEAAPAAGAAPAEKAPAAGAPGEKKPDEKKPAAKAADILPALEVPLE